MKKPEHVAPEAEEILETEFEDSETPTIPEGPTFASLGLPKRMLEALTALGFVTPTPIQANAIPALLEGRDLVGQARTGTGKTAAFGLPLIARLGKAKSRRTPRAIVMTPTRELALQVTDALRQFSEGSGLSFLTVYGGSAYGPQLRGLREGVDVVIGTPGRVIDLMDRGDLKLGEVEVVVLDEADEMLEMGFIDAVETILAGTPEATRQVALFSATMPTQIRKVAERYLKDPVNVRDASQTVVEIDQCYMQVPPRFKREALLRILRSEDRGATLVFASTRISCAEAADFLSISGIPAEPLHGDLSQPARERVVELLRARRVEVVVATDIAARGIDIEHLTHIINLDLPKNVEVYTHRIGRTGRAGRSGKAITLVVPRESMRFTEALRRRGVQLAEMFIASEHDLALRQRGAVAQDISALVDGAKLADATRWANELIAGGVSAEDLAARALALLGDAKSLRFGETLDKGLPPWARQPAHALQDRNNQRPAYEAKEPRKRKEPYADGPRGRHDDGAMERDDGPQGEGFVIINIGRNQAVRPADLVGALTNELGLTGRDIGRVEIRDNASVIGVPAAFAARVGDDAWPVTIRRIETTVRRFDQPIAAHPAKKPYVKKADGPKWSPLDPPRNVEEPARATAPRETRPASTDERPARPTRDTRPTERAPTRKDTREAHAAHDALHDRPARATRDTQPPDASAERPTRATRDTRPTEASAERPTRATRDTRPPEASAERPTRATRDTRPPEASAERPTRATRDTRPPERDTRPSRTRDERPAPEARLPYGRKTDAARPSRAPAPSARPERASAERKPAAPATRAPSKRPAKATIADRPPRRAIDVEPRAPRSSRD